MKDSLQISMDQRDDDIVLRGTIVKVQHLTGRRGDQIWVGQLASAVHERLVELWVSNPKLVPRMPKVGVRAVFTGLYQGIETGSHDRGATVTVSVRTFRVLGDGAPRARTVQVWKRYKARRESPHPPPLSR